MGFQNRKPDAFFFHFLVSEPEAAHQLIAAPFKEDQVIGVVDNAHLVRVSVRDAVSEFYFFHQKGGSPYSLMSLEPEVWPLWASFWLPPLEPKPKPPPWLAKPPCCWLG